MAIMLLLLLLLLLLLYGRSVGGDVKGKPTRVS